MYFTDKNFNEILGNSLISQDTFAYIKMFQIALCHKLKQFIRVNGPYTNCKMQNRLK